MRWNAPGGPRASAGNGPFWNDLHFGAHFQFRFAHCTAEPALDRISPVPEPVLIGGKNYWVECQGTRIMEAA